VEAAVETGWEAGPEALEPIAATGAVCPEALEAAPEPVELEHPPRPIAFGADQAVEAAVDMPLELEGSEELGAVEAAVERLVQLEPLEALEALDACKSSRGDV